MLIADSFPLKSSHVIMNIFYTILLYNLCLVNSSTFYDSCTWCLLTRKEFVKVEYQALSQPIYQCLGSPNQTIPLIILRNATITSIKNCTWEKVGLTRNLDMIDNQDITSSQDIEYLLHYVSHTIKMLNHSYAQDITLGKYNRQESIGKLLYL